MVTILITVAFIFIIYACITKGQVFGQTNKLLNLIIFGSIALFLILSIVTIINLDTNKIIKIEQVDYIPLSSDSTNTYYSFKNDNIFAYNKINDTSMQVIRYTPDDCIIDTTSNINYITRISAEYIPTVWVSSFMLPNIKTMRILHMTRKEYHNLSNFNSSNRWTIQKSL